MIADTATTVSLVRARITRCGCVFLLCPVGQGSLLTVAPCTQYATMYRLYCFSFRLISVAYCLKTVATDIVPKD